MAPIVDILVHEPIYFKDNLKRFLNSGFSYVKARAAALEEIHPGWGAFVSSPNNSLALSYNERILKMGHPLKCQAIKRVGPGFHDSRLHPVFASATAIRKGLYEGKVEEAKKTLPPLTLPVLERCLEKGKVVLSNRMLWRLGRFLLLRGETKETALSSGITEGMENRLFKMALRSSSWEDFVSGCTTGRYPSGRIRRQLIHFLLRISQKENRALQQWGPRYIRALGADSVGIELLRQMRSSSRLPVIGKAPSDFKGAGAILSRIEGSAERLWEELTEVYTPGEEKKRSFIRKEYFPGGETAP